MTNLAWRIIYIWFAICMIYAAYAVEQKEVDLYAEKVCEYYKINPEVIKSIIFTESRYDENAIGITGDYGLMQVTEPAFEFYLSNNPSTWIKDFKLIKNNWKANMIVGIWLYQYHKKRTGSVFLALASYNGGPGFGTESKIYAHKVLLSM